MLRLRAVSFNLFTKGLDDSNVCITLSLLSTFLRPIIAKSFPDGRILKSDTSIAKNYLDEQQIRRLERTVTGYFDYIEDLIERENTFTMQEFAASINEFLSFRRYQILPDKGRISHKRALEKAAQEYEIFNKTQKITSDFDRAVAQLTAGQKGAN